MRNHTATMAAAISPAMTPSRRYRDRESMGDLLSSTCRRDDANLWQRVYHHPESRANYPCADALTRCSLLGERLGGVGSETDDHLADIVAGEQTEKRLGRVLDAFHDGLLPLDPAGLEPASYLGEELRIEAQVVGDDEALHVHAIADHGEERARPRIGALEVVLGDHAAEGDAGEGIDLAQDHVEEGAAHVLEIDVDALGAGFAERPEHVPRRLVVDGGVRPELARDIGALVVGARGTHYPAAEDLTHLDDEGAGGGRRSRGHERLARLGPSDLLEPVPSREAGTAEHTQIGRPRE